MLLYVILIMTACLAHAGTGYAKIIQYPDAQKIRVAVYPFNDIREMALDQEIAYLIRGGLAKEKNIEIIPVDTIRYAVYSIEPSIMWTEKKGATPKGGILWDITPHIVEEVSDSLSTDFSIYGSSIRDSENWALEIFVLKSRDEEDVKSFAVAGLQEGNIEKKISLLASDIHDWLMRESVLTFAEEEIRRFMGGMSSYRAVVEKVAGYVTSYPESIPLRSLLLDLYLREKDSNTKEIVQEGMKLTERVETASQSDIRYILSLSLDPFDVVADVHEEIMEWDKAIEIRKRALTAFPYKSREHREAIGRDYYHIASVFEEKGQKVKAKKNYTNALSYLASSGEYYDKAQDALIRLEYK